MKFRWTNVVRVLFFALFLFLIFTGKTMIWLALFGLSLLGALIFGRFYCGAICPMNSAMLPADRLSRLLKIKKLKTPKWMKSGWFAGAVLVLLVAVTVVSKVMFKSDIPTLAFLVVLSALLTLFYDPAVFHNLICPFGILQKLFGRMPAYSKQVKEADCIGCAKCVKVCPSDAIAVADKKAAITASLCHQCERCGDVCPTSAIAYERSR